MNIQEAINHMFMGEYVVNNKIDTVDYYRIREGTLYGMIFENYEGETEIELSLKEIISCDYEVRCYREICEKRNI